MKKQFHIPQIRIIDLPEVDIVTTSGGEEPEGLRISRQRQQSIWNEDSVW